MTARPHVSAVDAFDLPEWLGTGEVTWTALTSVHSGHLVEGDDVFVAATGVTSGALLRGVRVVGDRVETESIVMRSRSGTFRRIVASHPLTKIQSLMKGAP